MVAGNQLVFRVFGTPVHHFFANIYLLTSFWSCGKISAVKQLRLSSRPFAGLFCRLLGEKLQSSG